MSATIQQVAKVLGVSVRGVRLRVDALDGIIDPYIRRGENNRLIFTGEAVGLLQRLEELRHRDGLSVKAAASILRQSRNDEEKERSTQVEPTTTDPLRELVEELRRECDRWRELALDLQKQVETLTVRALPAPRRRWWWPPWHRGGDRVADRVR